MTGRCRRRDRRSTRSVSRNPPCAPPRHARVRWTLSANDGSSAATERTPPTSAATATRKGPKRIPLRRTSAGEDLPARRLQRRRRSRITSAVGAGSGIERRERHHHPLHARQALDDGPLGAQLVVLAFEHDHEQVDPRERARHEPRPSPRGVMEMPSARQSGRPGESPGRRLRVFAQLLTSLEIGRGRRGSFREPRGRRRFRGRRGTRCRCRRRRRGCLGRVREARARHTGEIAGARVVGVLVVEVGADAVHQPAARPVEHGNGAARRFFSAVACAFTGHGRAPIRWATRCR